MAVAPGTPDFTIATSGLYNQGGGKSEQIRAGDAGWVNRTRKGQMHPSANTDFLVSLERHYDTGKQVWVPGHILKLDTTRVKFDQPYQVNIERKIQMPGRVIILRKGDRGVVWYYRESLLGGTRDYLLSLPHTPGAKYQTLWMADHLAREILLLGGSIYGQLSIKFNRGMDATDTNSTLASPLRWPTQTSPLLETVRLFFKGIGKDEELTRLMLPVFTKYTDTQFRDVAMEVCKGIGDAGLGTVLQMPGFTVQDICNKARRVKDSEMTTSGLVVSGVYMWLHTKGPEHNVHHCYFGQSNNIGYRCQQHIWNAKELTHQERHYHAWRSTDYHRCYIVCRIANNMPDKKMRELLDWAELFFIAMLQSYASCMTSSTAAAIEEGNKYDEANTEELDSASLKLPVVSVGPKRKSSKIRHFNQRCAATAMCAYVGKVMTKTQWPGGCARPSFGLQHGHNMGTPMSIFDAQQGEKVIYYKTSVSPKMDIYTRSAVIYRHGPQRQHFWVGQHLHLHFSYAELDLGPISAGTPLYLSFEIMKPGAGPHAVSFARLPLLPDSDDWIAARSLGLGMTWCDNNGRWNKKYLQTTMYHNSGERRAKESYVKAINIVRYLQGELWQPPAGKDVPSFMRPFAAPALVYGLSFDWLNQALIVDTQQRRELIPLPRLYDVKWRMKQLLDAGAILMTSAGNKRGDKCDLCALAQVDPYKHRVPHISGHSKACDGQADTACWRCKLYNIQCTRTPGIISMTEDSKLIRLLTHEKLETGSAEVEDPQITTVGRES